jgi:hypothetical protein
MLLFACAAFVLAAAPAPAQEMDEAAMMEAWQESMTPGEVHEYLASFAGDWDVTAKMYMDPSQSPMESTGKTTKSMILGGRFLQEKMTGTMMGMPMEALGYTGYNNTTGKMEFSWMDNMGTMIMTGAGERDGETMTLMSEFMDPMTGKPAKVKMVVQANGPDEHTFTMYDASGSKNVLHMEVRYTRAK